MGVSEERMMETGWPDTTERPVHFSKKVIADMAQGLEDQSMRRGAQSFVKGSADHES